MWRVSTGKIVKNSSRRSSICSNTHDSVKLEVISAKSSCDKEVPKINNISTALGTSLSVVWFISRKTHEQEGKLKLAGGVCTLAKHGKAALYLLNLISSILS